jgi:hypothetical protein
VSEATEPTCAICGVCESWHSRTGCDKWTPENRPFEHANAEDRTTKLEAALRLVLMKSVDFDNSFCYLCQTKDRHADDCVSKIANAALVNQ